MLNVQFRHHLAEGESTAQKPSGSPFRFLPWIEMRQCVWLLSFIALGCGPKKLPGESVAPRAEREIVEAINAAQRPLDLAEAFALDLDSAQRVFEAREDVLARGLLLGLRDLRLDPEILRRIRDAFAPRTIGTWEILPYGVQRPDGSVFGTAHAALLKTGWVLFLPRFDSNETLLWNPADETSPVFQLPDPQPDDFLFCSGHSFLSDGRLLTVGGGGNSAGNAISSAWHFDPVSREWASTKSDMARRRWYPTAVTLGDGRVLVASGWGVDKLEIYDVAQDTFSFLEGPPTNSGGADRLFPETYPSLHLLPNGDIFFSRTGWGHGNNEPPGFTSRFQFQTSTSGEWTDIASPMNSSDRTEGMSVILLDGTPPQAKVMIIGGGDPSQTGRGSAETIDFSLTPPAFSGHPSFLPDQRFNVNAVLLPDGQVLVVGGRSVQDSPALLFNPATSVWRQVARVNYRREYHSIALLLPNGKVATTGGDFGNTQSQRTSIELYSPPYLFRGPRPTIGDAPDSVNYGESFEVATPEASDIDSAVLVRPMAVTHHTDSEQRRIELEIDRRYGNLVLQAPAGRNARNTAPPGYYMLFLLADGVPSEAKFIRLACPDPAVASLDFSIINRLSQFRGLVRIEATIRNVGSIFDSGSGQQAAVLYENGTEVARTAFEDLPPHATVTVRFERNWNSSSPAEGEFPPTYRVAIQYDPDIFLDANPKNDDCNLGNNRLERNGSDINALF